MSNWTVTVFQYTLSVLKIYRVYNVNYRFLILNVYRQCISEHNSI